MGPLDVLESIAEVADWQVADGQIVYLLTFSFFLLSEQVGEGGSPGVFAQLGLPALAPQA